jgi:hypothetical protein
MKHTIDIQRVYERVGDDGPVHFLVDRLRPRGIKKDSVKLDGWLKEVAPSNELRDWFGHDPQARAPLGAIVQMPQFMRRSRQTCERTRWTSTPCSSPKNSSLRSTMLSMTFESLDASASRDSFHKGGTS